MAADIKHPNIPRISTLVGLNFVALIIALSADTYASGLRSILEIWKPALPAGLSVLVASVLTSLLSSTAKARLVFLRWRHPLPGSRAFTEIGPRDPRVNMDKFKSDLSGLAATPDEQNRAWYKLYMSHRHDPSIINCQQSYLDHRDCAAIAAMLLVPFTVVTIFFSKNWMTTLCVICALIAEFFLFRRAAAVRGMALVGTVLAVATAI